MVNLRGVIGCGYCDRRIRLPATEKPHEKAFAGYCLPFTGIGRVRTRFLARPSQFVCYLRGTMPVGIAIRPLGESAMLSILRRFWNDDRGAIVSVELILIIAILIFGLIAGFVALRNSVTAVLGTIGNVLVTTTPSFTYSGFAIGNFFGGRTIAQVEGYSISPNLVPPLTASQTVPIFLGTINAIPPAP
jgi:Flp pilus assembly pilin Flp